MPGPVSRLGKSDGASLSDALVTAGITAVGMDGVSVVDTSGHQGTLHICLNTSSVRAGNDNLVPNRIEPPNQTRGK